VSYTYLYGSGEQRVARTVEASPGVLFDLDDQGRILGAETIGDSFDWTGALATLAMSGRLAVPGHE
jgi:hypothetical protein